MAEQLLNPDQNSVQENPRAFTQFIPPPRFTEQPTAIRSPIPHTTGLTSLEIQAFVDSLPPETHHLVYTVLQCNPPENGQTKPVPGPAPPPVTLPATLPATLPGLAPGTTLQGTGTLLDPILIPEPILALPAVVPLPELGPGPAPIPETVPVPAPVTLLTPIPLKPVPQLPPTLLTPIPTKPTPQLPATPLPPGSPLENIHQYLDFTRRLQVHLSRPGETTLSDADVRVIKEIASLPLPNAFTVPVCQEWVNFVSTFHGNVKVTLDPKYKSNKFKFEFFQQIALFYCIKNFIENQNQPTRPADEVDLNQMSYTDRMDVITTSVVSVLHSWFSHQINDLTKQRDDLKQTVQILNEKTRNQNHGYGYLFPPIDQLLMSRKRPAILSEGNSLTIYKVSFIGCCDLIMKMGDVKEEAKQISKALSSMKNSLRNDCTSNSASISISDEELTIHHPKASKIALCKIACLFVDGVDRNFFCLGHFFGKSDIMKIMVFCTNTLTLTAEIANIIHRRTIVRRPESHNAILIQHP